MNLPREEGGEKDSPSNDGERKIAAWSRKNKPKRGGTLTGTGNKFQGSRSGWGVLTKKYYGPPKVSRKKGEKPCI